MNIEELSKQYEGGKSLRELAEEYGIDHTTLYRKLKKIGVVRQQKKDICTDLVIKLYNEGLSCRQIARSLETTHPTISKIIKENINKKIPKDLFLWVKTYANFTPLQDRVGMYCKEKDYYIYYIELNSIPYKDYCKELTKERSIIIFEDEWALRMDQVKDFILAKLGIYQKRIYARKCSLLQVDKKTAVQFINENHIQKTNNPGIVNFGLYCEGDLVGLCQLRKHHRNSKDITISRMCFKRGIQITGGFSRLVKHSIDWCFNNNYNKVVTWSDNRITNGSSYIVAGFKEAAKLKPDYSYIHPNHPGKRFSKQSMKKSNIGCPDGYTEREWTEKLGYSRVWDCGKTKFEYYNNKPPS